MVILGGNTYNQILKIMEYLELKVLELGCLYLDPYEFYSPNGKQVVCRYNIDDFYDRQDDGFGGQ